MSNEEPSLCTVKNDNENVPPVDKLLSTTNLGLLSGLTDKPPDNLLDSDDADVPAPTSVSMDPDLCGSQDSVTSISSSPLAPPPVPIKNYVNNCKQDADHMDVNDREMASTYFMIENEKEEEPTVSQKLEDLQNEEEEKENNDTNQSEDFMTKDVDVENKVDSEQLEDFLETDQQMKVQNDTEKTKDISMEVTKSQTITESQTIDNVLKDNALEISLVAAASDDKRQEIAQPPEYNRDISSGVEGDMDTDASEGKHTTPQRRVVETPTLRRSARSNKGIGKEIFDPSYIPISHRRSNDRRSHESNKHIHSPSTERSDSPVSSTASSPGRAKSRIVVGQSPRRISPRVTSSQKEQESSQDEQPPNSQSKRSEEKMKSGTAPRRNKFKRIIEPKKVKSKEDFSDDDDNVPLNKLKDPTASSSEDEDSDSDDSYNNPNRLWCICRKPHNNRFMISCDECEDWFHGDCVGITLACGKKMEQNNEEYVCPACVEKRQGKKQKCSEKRPEVEKAQERRKSKEKPSVVKEKKEPDVKQKSVSLKQKSASAKNEKTHAHKRPAATADDKAKLPSGVSLKGYALQGQIQPAIKPGDVENGPPQKKKIKVFSDAKENVDSKKEVKEEIKQEPSPEKKTARKCIVSTCDNDALPGSVYCSNQCILRHAKESLKAITTDKHKAEFKPKLLKREEGMFVSKPEYKDRVPVICRKTNKVLSGSSAPPRKELAHFLKTHPSYEIHRSQSSSTSHDKPQTKPSLHSQPSKDNSSSVSSTDFYRHVEHQNRKRDRYGMDPDYAPPVKKPGDPNPYIKKQHIATNVVKVSQSSSDKLVKHRKDSTERSKKTEERRSSKEMRRIEEMKRKKKDDVDVKKKHKDDDSRELKRKHSTDFASVKKSSEEKAKKVERTPSGGSKSDNKTSQTSGDIRQTIKKSLLDILKNRSENSEDLKMHPDSINKLSNKIEESLFKVYGDTNMKYKNKYRSIMFNLKDTRNQGLWRKVIIGEVTTSELVQMTAEQMASKKLAEWRQNKLIQELDIIQKQEKENANVRPIAKITHKGEIAIQEDLSDLTENFSSREHTSAPTIAPTRKKRISMSEDDNSDLLSTPAPNDTTLQHSEHLFDLNCKICTGKLKEEDLGSVDTPADAPKKVKRSTSIILSSEAQNASIEAQSPTTPTSQIIVSKSDKKKKQKVTADESDVKSHDDLLSPASFLSNLAEKRRKKPVLPAPPPLSDVVVHENTESQPATPKEEEKIDKSKESDEMNKNESAKGSPSPPSSTPQAPAAPKLVRSNSKLIWSGSISMLELSTFKANIYPGNGCCDNLDIDLPVRLVLGGRIHPKVVWDYLSKVSVLPSKQLSVVRFHAATDDDRVGYVAMLSYFSSRKRFGVVSNQDRMLVKDMYLIPLLESQPIPGQLIFCSPGIEKALSSNRPSMLLGIVVRQLAKTTKLNEVEIKKPVESSAQKEEIAQDKEEEYIPDDAPLIHDTKDSPVPLLTDEELGSKKENKSSSGASLFERNRSLAPSLRFYMRKQSEEEQSRREQQKNINPDDERPYSPSEELKTNNEDEGGDYDPEDAINGDNEDEEPYDPEKMFQEEETEEEYDPETAFAPVSPKNDDDIPYDPEEEEEFLKAQTASKEMDELVEKQAHLEKMKRELEEKKAKLAEVEQTLQKSTAVVKDPPEPPRLDPRLARRAVPQVEEKTAETSAIPDLPSVQETPKLTADIPKPIVKPNIPVVIQPKPDMDTEVDASKSVPPEIPAVVNPLQTILSVLNMTQTQQPQTAKAPDIFSVLKKPSSPPPLPDSTTKSDPEDAELPQKPSSLPSVSLTKSDPEAAKQDKNAGLVAYADSPNSELNQDDEEKKKHKKKEERRRRSSSESSFSSRDSDYRRRRQDHDDRKHHRRHGNRRSRSRSRSRSPYRGSRHSPRRHRRHDDSHRRHRRSWSGDRRR
ncbi:unnamed protein product [Clavelina lepadiformis]|uniref:Death-inducer obliterator 1 n=1 Tax=Clavelina lepadiformis TaxID=159417 RepID=A0ABP0FW02_CLALP